MATSWLRRAGFQVELATNPKIMATLLWWLGGRGEGDGVAERFELANVVALLPSGLRVKWSGPRSVNLASSLASRCQTMTKMERPTATIAGFLPRGLVMRRYRSPRKVQTLQHRGAAKTWPIGR